MRERYYGGNSVYFMLTNIYTAMISYKKITLTNPQKLLECLNTMIMDTGATCNSTIHSEVIVIMQEYGQ